MENLFDIEEFSCCVKEVNSCSQNTSSYQARYNLLHLEEYVCFRACRRNLVCLQMLIKNLKNAFMKVENVAF